MHDEGTGGNTNGGYGVFPLFPLAGCAFGSCPAALDARKTKRAAGADSAGPPSSPLVSALMSVA